MRRRPRSPVATSPPSRSSRARGRRPGADVAPYRVAGRASSADAAPRRLGAPAGPRVSIAIGALPRPSEPPARQSRRRARRRRRSASARGRRGRAIAAAGAFSTIPVAKVPAGRPRPRPRRTRQCPRSSRAGSRAVPRVSDRPSRTSTCWDRTSSSSLATVTATPRAGAHVRHQASARRS